MATGVHTSMTTNQLEKSSVKTYPVLFYGILAEQTKWYHIWFHAYPAQCMVCMVSGVENRFKFFTGQTDDKLTDEQTNNLTPSRMHTHGNEAYMSLVECNVHDPICKVTEYFLTLSSQQS